MVQLEAIQKQLDFIEKQIDKVQGEVDEIGRDIKEKEEELAEAVNISQGGGQQGGLSVATSSSGPLLRSGSDQELEVTDQVIKKAKKHFKKNVEKLLEDYEESQRTLEEQQERFGNMLKKEFVLKSVDGKFYNYHEFGCSYIWNETARDFADVNVNKTGTHSVTAASGFGKSRLARELCIRRKWSPIFILFAELRTTEVTTVWDHVILKLRVPANTEQEEQNMQVLFQMFTAHVLWTLLLVSRCRKKKKRNSLKFFGF